MINTPPPLERSFSMGNPEEGSENSLHSGKELTAGGTFEHAQI